MAAADTTVWLSRGAEVWLVRLRDPAAGEARVEALELSGELLGQVNHIFSNLNSAETNEELQAVAKRYRQRTKRRVAAPDLMLYLTRRSRYIRTGGVIVLDASGQVAMPFDAEGMYRGVMGPDGKAATAIYDDP